MTEVFPIWVIVFDYSMGIVMWTLIGRTGMSIFQPEDSKFFFSRVFIKLTEPILKAFAVVTPGFLIRPMIPLYIAWFFFMIRFYLMPWLLGYDVMGMLSFPLEGDIAASIYRIGSGS